MGNKPGLTNDPQHSCRPVFSYGRDESRPRRYRLLWLLPAVVLGLAAGLADPAGYLRSGDPWYDTLYSLSGWLFLSSFCYSLLLGVATLILVLFREDRQARELCRRIDLGQIDPRSVAQRTDNTEQEISGNAVRFPIEDRGDASA